MGANLLIVTCTSYAQNFKLIDSIYLEIKTTESDSILAKQYNLIVREFALVGKWKDALDPAIKGYDYSVKSQYKQGIAANAYLLGSIYCYFADYEKGLKYYQISLSAWEELGNRSNIIQCLNSIQFIYQEIKDYEHLFHVNDRILGISRDCRDSSIWFSAQNSRRMFYFNLCRDALLQHDSLVANQNYDLCIQIHYSLVEYLKRNQKSDDAINYTAYLAHAIDASNYITNIDSLQLSVILNTSKYPKPDSLYNSVINHYLESGDSLACTLFFNMLGTYYKNLGILYAQQGDFSGSFSKFEKALNYLKVAHRLISIQGFKHGIANFSKDLGSVYMYLNDFSKANEILSIALSIFREIEYTDGVEEVYYLLYKNSIKAKNYLEALNYYELLSNVRNLILDSNKNKSIYELTIKYETDKKVQENQNLVLQNQIQLKENLLLAKQNQINILHMNKELADRLLAENLAEKRQDSIGWLSDQGEAQRKLSEQQIALAMAKEQLSTKRIQNRNLIIGTLSGLAALGGLIAFLISGIRKKKFDLAIKEREEKALRAQLKPHFVFNALAAIQKSVHDNPVLAESYLSKFSHFTQEVLANSEKKQITLNDELAMLSKYIELHSLRLHQPIEYYFIFTPEIDPEEIMVPPAILQPLVENSINHNFAGKETRGSIQVHFSLEGHLLKCILEDSCEGTKNEPAASKVSMRERKSFGLQIVRERLELWSKGKALTAFLELIPQSQGMRVILGIPL